MPSRYIDKAPSFTMGYDQERFVSQINDGLLCCICRDVLEDPLQGPCEHAFCAPCIHGWLVHENICPEDRRPLWVAELRPLFRYMKNDLDKLQIRCRNFRAGCEIICDLEFVDNHERECGYVSVQCPSIGCTVSLERRALDDHLKSCEFQTRECPHGCGMPILSTEDREHNCVAELRMAFEVLRSEIICKTEDQKREIDVRLDAQRRHMVQREGGVHAQIDELRAQVALQKQELAMISQAKQITDDEFTRAYKNNEDIKVLKFVVKDLEDMRQELTFLNGQVKEQRIQIERQQKEIQEYSEHKTVVENELQNYESKTNSQNQQLNEQGNKISKLEKENLELSEKLNSFHRDCHPKKTVTRGLKITSL